MKLSVQVTILELETVQIVVGLTQGVTIDITFGGEEQIQQASNWVQSSALGNVILLFVTVIKQNTNLEYSTIIVC